MNTIFILFMTFTFHKIILVVVVLSSLDSSNVVKKYFSVKFWEILRRTQ